MKRLLAACLALALFGTTFAGAGSHVAAASLSENGDPPTDSAADTAETQEAPRYSAYLQSYSGAAYPDKEAFVSGPSFTKAEGSVNVQTIDGVEYAVTDEEGSVEWLIDIPEDGLYNLQVDYRTLEGKGGAAERKLLIDGELPFDEAKYLAFSRTWRDKPGEFPIDSSGNQMRPQQEEVFEERRVDLADPLGYATAPLYFYFTAGTHTLRLVSVREPLAIAGIRAYQSKVIPSYEEYLKEYAAQPGGDTLYFEAEYCAAKSDFSIYPYNDNTSAYSTPQDAFKLYLNAIGGSKWQTSGQWITWEFDVETPGLYQIIPRTRQNIRSGTFVSRRLLIDGEVPFREAETLRFLYNSKWVEKPLSDGETPYTFYFSAGHHTLTMEVVLGDMAESLGKINDIMTAVNGLYRDILMITGSVPDPYRDYEFPILIPDTLKGLGEQAAKLREVSEQLREITGAKGSDTVTLDRLAQQMQEMYEDPESIADLLTGFQQSISALGTWLITTSQQPLELDSISIIPAGQPYEGKKSSFFGQLWFDIQSLVASFVVDYNHVGNSGNGSVIDVWMVSGREQAQIVKQLAEDTYTPQYGPGVNVKVVSAGTLLPSVLAGIGPDVSLYNPSTDPINYAIRGAVQELSGFDTFDEVCARFPEEALESYRFNGGTYALPETVVFPMMFYRKDIFDQLGLTPPKTWEDLYALIPELQKRNMQIGYPITLTGYLTFLYQSGGSLYNDELSRSKLDSDESLDAFVKMMDLFTVYKFPVAYEPANRFRTGEMPLIIADYILYNQLAVFAPEIRGQWEFVPLPVTVREDGTESGVSPISNVPASTVAAGTSVGSPSTGAMMLRDAKDKEAAWDFLDWWMSDDTQASYCNEMEAVLGVASKHPTANKNVLSRLPWSASEYKNLAAQFDKLAGTPEVPGGYYISRNFDFAFFDVYNNQYPAAQTMLKYVKTINGEITRKRTEFGLE